jgi:hypothetical protein
MAGREMKLLVEVTRWDPPNRFGIKILNHMYGWDIWYNFLKSLTQRRSQVRVLFRPLKTPYPRGFCCLRSISLAARS